MCMCDTTKRAKLVTMGTYGILSSNLGNHGLMAGIHE